MMYQDQLTCKSDWLNIHERYFHELYTKSNDLKKLYKNLPSFDNNNFFN